MNPASLEVLVYDENPNQTSEAKSHRLLLTASLAILVAGAMPITEFGSGSVNATLRAACFVISIVLLTLTTKSSALDTRLLLKTFSPWLLLLLFWCALSIGWSAEPSASLIRTVESSLTAFYFHVWVVTAATNTNDDSEFADIVLKALLCAIIYGLMLNLAIAGTPFRLWLNPENPIRPRLVLGFTHPLVTGDIISIASLSLLCSTWGNISKILCLSFLAYLLLLSDSTASRLVVTVVIGYLFIFSTSGLANRLVRACLLIALGIFAVTLVFISDPEILENAIGGRRVTNLSGRSVIWQAIFTNNLHTTFLGTGFDASRNIIGALVGKPYHAHNLYLAILVELGIAGFIIFVPLLIAWFLRVFLAGSIFTVSLMFYALFLGLNNPALIWQTTHFISFMISFTLPFVRHLTLSPGRENR